MNYASDSMRIHREQLLSELSSKAYKVGDFTLSSGRQSKHYINCKPVSLSGPGLVLISNLMLEFVESDSSAVAGLTLGADPLVSGVSLLAAQKGRDLDGLIVRKEPKGHGTGQWLEGPLIPTGSRVTVLEDVVTTGRSSLKAVKQLRNVGYCVDRVISIIDRQEGGEEAMKNAGLELISLFLLKDVVNRANEK